MYLFISSPLADFIKLYVANVEKIDCLVVPSPDHNLLVLLAAVVLHLSVVLLSTKTSFITDIVRIRKFYDLDTEYLLIEAHWRLLNELLYLLLTDVLPGWSRLKANPTHQVSFTKKGRRNYKAFIMEILVQAVVGVLPGCSCLRSCPKHQVSYGQRYIEVINDVEGAETVLVLVLVGVLPGRPRLKGCPSHPVSSHTMTKDIFMIEIEGSCLFGFWSSGVLQSSPRTKDYSTPDVSQSKIKQNYKTNYNNQGQNCTTDLGQIRGQVSGQAAGVLPDNSCMRNCPPHLVSQRKEKMRKNNNVFKELKSSGPLSISRNLPHEWYWSLILPKSSQWCSTGQLLLEKLSLTPCKSTKQNKHKLQNCLSRIKPVPGLYPVAASPKIKIHCQVKSLSQVSGVLLDSSCLKNCPPHQVSQRKYKKYKKTNKNPSRTEIAFCSVLPDHCPLRDCPSSIQHILLSCPHISVGNVLASSVHSPSLPCLKEELYYEVNNKEKLYYMELKLVLIRMMMRFLIILIFTFWSLLSGVMTEWNRSMRSMNGNTKNWILVASQNIPGNVSINNKQLALDILLQQKKPHLLSVIEPRHSEMLTLEYSGYSLIQGQCNGVNDPRINLLVKDGIQYERVNLASDIPTVVVKVTSQTFIFFYREWRLDGVKETGGWDLQLERWRTFIEAWLKLKGNIIALGDANFEFWKNDTRHHHDCAPMKDLVMEKIISSGYVQIIRSDTRHQGRSSSCLDHVYSNLPSHIYSNSVCNRNYIGYDHNWISLKVSLNSPAYVQKMIEVRDIKNLSKEEFEQFWYSLDHSDFWLEPDVDEAVEAYAHKVQVVLNHLAPLRKIMIKTNNAPYLTPALLKEIKVRDSMWDRYKLSGTMEDLELFKIFRNKLRHKLTKAKKKFNVEQLDTSDPKKAMATVKRISGLEVKKSDKITLKVDGDLVTKPMEVAETLNEFFISKVDKIVETHPPDPDKASAYTDRYLSSKRLGTLEFQLVEQCQVREIIHKLRSTGATGTDGISVILLKKMGDCLAPFITQIVNLSILSGKYPSSFKAGLISPVPKSGDMMEAKNWRPVVILNSTSKVIERVLNLQLKTYLEEYGLLSQQQHAYRRFRSTQTAWLEVDTWISANMEAKRISALQLLDLSAAFNLCPRQILIPKLRKIGLTEKACQLLESYMTNRRNAVKIQTSISTFRPVDTGIGEGSVLGPLVFLVCIMETSMIVDIIKERLEVISPELAADVDLETCCFADDTTVMHSASNDTNLQIAMNVASHEFSTYLSIVGMKVNITKEEHITFAPKAFKRELLNGVVVDGRKEAKQVKLLGITVATDYSFTAHVSNIVSRVSHRVAHVRRLQQYLSEKKLKELADTLLLSVLRYGLEVAGRDLVNLKRLQKVLNVILRLISKADKFTSVRLMQARLAVLNMRLQFHKQRTSLIRSVLTSGVSPLTLHFVDFPRHHARLAKYRHSFPIKSKYGENSILVTSLEVLNDMGYLKHLWSVSHQPGKQWFSTNIVNYLLSKYDNGNIK